MVMASGLWAVDRVAADGRDTADIELRERSSTAAAFLAAYVDSQAALGRRAAEDLLATPVVEPERLQLAVNALEYAAAGVLTGEGVLIAVIPGRPDLIGRNQTGVLEHVKTAVELNRVGVSRVVISPALATPAVGIAVPFATPEGRRIFSGVFTVNGATVARIVRQSVGLPVSEALVVDSNGNVVAATAGPPPPAVLTPFSSAVPALAAAVEREPSGSFRSGGSRWGFASAPIAGTPWTLVTEVPDSNLYRTVNDFERQNLALLAGAGALGLAAVAVLGLSSRRRLTAEQRTTEANRALSSANAALLTSNRELEGFSYSVSHDLRTPLRAVQGYSRILLDEHTDRLDADGRQLLGNVIDYTARMSQLIDDLLAFARVGRRDLQPEQVDTVALVRSVVDELRAAEPARQVSVVVGRLADASVDRTLIRLVWANVLSNALKFTSTTDSAEIRVDSEVTFDEVVYHVRDNGVGFDMRYAGKLFGVFQRLHPGDFPGTGMGLAIAARVVARHGGRIWAEGAVGRGACFSFSVPRLSEGRGTDGS